MRYLLSLCYDDVAAPADQGPPLTGGPLDALTIRLHWAHGRLEELRHEPASRWAAAVADPMRISALLAIGETEEAAQISGRSGPPAAPQAWLEVMATVELLAELGRDREASEQLAAGHALIEPTGSIVLEMLSQVLEARLALAAGDLRGAYAVLDELEGDGTPRRYRFIAELADTWRGLAALKSGDDEDAVAALRRAVSSMVAGDRGLELPRAAVYLAEAEWRAGDEDAADTAARVALTAAERQGSSHRLLQALADVPAVAARSMDAEADSTADWHRLGRALLGRASIPEVRSPLSIRLREFGELTILRADQPVHTRLRKTAELMAYLGARSEPAASRQELLDVLFEGRDDSSTRAYLRQVIADLRTVMPDETGLHVDPQRVAFAGHDTLVSDSRELEAVLSRAEGRDGEERIAALTRALTIAGPGDYLPGVSSAWAEERRTTLAHRLAEANIDLGELLFEHGHYAHARRRASAAIAADPYGERAWRLVMSIAAAVGDADGVLDAFRRCGAHLAEIGMEPSTTTRTHVERLRV
jgi:DNA-binding SARP family transcriptional activator